ncbi:heavy metal translocating P-type ATPase [Weeksellaceae bacterium KMM 9713]|uniref:P-type Zn(2+) transporter n=1 Tax=Profundicola chukchiensis TaxID=2961959 RepID=A0A9X4RUN3_9FLAO|nr:heavy metal translocating P-type ATPase [Profundicola chukchiensis]MDG4944940.1 heavy metal translocating P-type ATPase [Profundicola chukchiensis]MDG4950028.1 heavy metal translocating P-type ATPase [Profundicola chukchiensis]
MEKHTENQQVSDCCHEHNHGGFLGENTELYFAIAAGVFFFAGLVFEHLLDLNEWFAKGSFIISLLFGGFYTAKEAIEKTSKGEFEIDFLMLAAAVGAVYIDRWGEAALLLFLFSLGHALEHYAMNRARKNIKSLGELSPKVAFLKVNGDVVETPIEDLKIGDVILVKPNSKIAADGVVIEGSSSVNQANITGESMPVDKEAFTGDVGNKKFEDFDSLNRVYTGSINGDRALEIQVLKLSTDSAIARMISLVSEVEGNKSPTQLLTKKFEKWYVPSVIVVIFLLCFAFLVLDETYEESLYRAITVLVAASPCALAISTPSAVLSGVARAARGGVLIKGGRALENLGNLRTIAFDKTGTLTEGKPKLTSIVALNNFDLTELKQMVLGVEGLSNHPLARSIAKALEEEHKVRNEKSVADLESIQGMGITAQYDNRTVFIGNERLMQENRIMVSAQIKDKMQELLSNGETAMLVAYNNLLVGLISVMDLPRDTAKSTLKELKKIGIENMVMLTGDHQNVGDNIAKQIGLTEAKGGLMPEDKVAAIKELMAKYEKVAMIGDGVNDAPAMATATVGVAMGAAGSDVALETADVALMSDKIERLPFLIGLSRASKRIIHQNIWISMGMVAILVPLTLFGIASIGPAVIFHEGSTLLVVLNALRLLAYKEK